MRVLARAQALEAIKEVLGVGPDSRTFPIRLPETTIVHQRAVGASDGSPVLERPLLLHEAMHGLFDGVRDALLDQRHHDSHGVGRYLDRVLERPHIVRGELVLWQAVGVAGTPVWVNKNKGGTAAAFAHLTGALARWGKVDTATALAL